MPAYYNEIDPYAAQWLRNLIAAGAIAPGDVDERSIVDVRPADLGGFEQCHFFAGVGGWSYALRLAGWPDNRPVWTGSCPCQPFSGTGKRARQSDERHLWPDWHRLIKQWCPPTVFGEQVEDAVAAGWLDDAFSDLEATGYACAAAVLPAYSVGSPHERQRIWLVADRYEGSERPKWNRGLQGSQADFWAGLVLPPRGGVDHGLSRNVAQVGTLGNAIVPQVAAEFIAAYAECEP